MRKIGISLSVCCMIVLLSTGNTQCYTQQQNTLTPIQAVTTSQKNELNIRLKSELIIPEKDIKEYQFIIDKTKNTNCQSIKDYTNEDLYLLSQVIYSEAGSDWISDEIQLMVGNIVLNRIEDSRFPNTLYDVVHQKGQYQFILQDIEVIPNQRAIDNAKQLLEGLRICPENIVWQSESIQGMGVYKTYETKYTTLYFCY